MPVIPSNTLKIYEEKFEKLREKTKEFLEDYKKKHGSPWITPENISRINAATFIKRVSDHVSGNKDKLKIFFPNTAPTKYKSVQFQISVVEAVLILEARRREEDEQTYKQTYTFRLFDAIKLSKVVHTEITNTALYSLIMHALDKKSLSEFTQEDINTHFTNLISYIETMGDNNHWEMDDYTQKALAEMKAITTVKVDDMSPLTL